MDDSERTTFTRVLDVLECSATLSLFRVLRKTSDAVGISKPEPPVEVTTLMLENGRRWILEGCLVSTLIKMTGDGAVYTIPLGTPDWYKAKYRGRWEPEFLTLKRTYPKKLPSDEKKSVGKKPPSEGTGAPAGKKLPSEVKKAPAGGNLPSGEKNAPVGKGLPSREKDAPAARNLPSGEKNAPVARNLPSGQKNAPAGKNLPSEVKKGPARGNLPSGKKNAPVARNLPSAEKDAPVARNLPSGQEDAPAGKKLPSGEKKAAAKTGQKAKKRQDRIEYRLGSPHSGLKIVFEPYGKRGDKAAIKATLKTCSGLPIEYSHFAPEITKAMKKGKINLAHELQYVQEMKGQKYPGSEKPEIAKPEIEKEKFDEKYSDETSVRDGDLQSFDEKRPKAQRPAFFKGFLSKSG